MPSGSNPGGEDGKAGGSVGSGVRNRASALKGFAVVNSSRLVQCTSNDGTSGRA